MRGGSRTEDANLYLSGSGRVPHYDITGVFTSARRCWNQPHDLVDLSDGLTILLYPYLELGTVNPFPLVISDVLPTPPPSVIINNPGGQKLFIIRVAYLLKGFGRAAFKFLLESINIELKSR